VRRSTGTTDDLIGRVTILAILRRLGRNLMPPRNRGSLETEYRQPNSMRQMAEREARPHQPGNWAGQ
jgi:hypothetical protein